MVLADGALALIVLAAALAAAVLGAALYYLRSSSSESVRLVGSHAVATIILAAPFWFWSIDLIAKGTPDSGVVIFLLAMIVAWFQLFRPIATWQRWGTLAASGGAPTCTQM